MNVILLKTETVATQAEIDAMVARDLRNHLEKAQRLLNDQGRTEEANSVSYIMYTLDFPVENKTDQAVVTV